MMHALPVFNICSTMKFLQTICVIKWTKQTLQTPLLSASRSVQVQNLAYTANDNFQNSVRFATCGASYQQHLRTLGTERRYRAHGEHERKRGHRWKEFALPLDVLAALTKAKLVTFMILPLMWFRFRKHRRHGVCVWAWCQESCFSTFEEWIIVCIWPAIDDRYFGGRITTRVTSRICFGLFCDFFWSGLYGSGLISRKTDGLKGVRMRIEVKCCRGW